MFKPILLIPFIVFAACTPPEEGKLSKSITIMTFNVENLFDTKDDPRKSDETYLPRDQKKSLSHKKKCEGYRFDKWKQQCLNWDWSERVLQKKLKHLGDAIKQVKNGLGPDVLILQEVENERVLRRLRDEQLSDSKYTSLELIEGRDRRGIDVAVLSRLKLLGQPKLHPMAFKGFAKNRVEDTRGVLQTDLALPNGATLTVLAVHFPAPFHPVEMRVQAFKSLNKLRESLPQDRYVVAAGDFNVPSEEDRKTKILDTHVSPQWLISHRIGCEGCNGTNYYPPKKSWSFLDMILLSKNLSHDQSSWKVLPNTVRLANSSPEQSTKNGKPKRFRLPDATGVSDHWPIALDIVLRPVQ